MKSAIKADATAYQSVHVNYRNHRVPNGTQCVFDNWKIFN